MKTEAEIRQDLKEAEFELQVLERPDPEVRKQELRVLVGYMRSILGESVPQSPGPERSRVAENDMEKLITTVAPLGVDESPIHGLADRSRMAKDGAADRALQALRKIGKPSTIAGIVEAMGEDPSNTRFKNTVGSALQFWYEKRRFFTRPQVGIYGLTEWEEENPKPELNGHSQNLLEGAGTV
jgi:hypothetical protein